MVTRYCLYYHRRDLETLFKGVHAHWENRTEMSLACNYAYGCKAVDEAIFFSWWILNLWDF